MFGGIQKGRLKRLNERQTDLVREKLHNVFPDKSCVSTRIADCHSMDRPWYRRLFNGARKIVVPSNRSLAEGGNADAQFALGAQSAAHGPSHDFTQAAAWYLKA